MDTRLVQGDFLTDSYGNPIAIYGIDEACQRAELLLSVIKGTFIYDREFGSYLYRAGVTASNEKLMMICREAFVGRDDMELLSAEYQTFNDVTYLVIEIRYGNEISMAGVKIRA